MFAAVNLFQTGGALPPVNTAAPSISGSTVAGSTLTATTGTWVGAPTITYSYQWQHGTTNIPGATSSTYVISSSYRTETIRCVVTATNSVSSVSANSSATAAVTVTVSGSLSSSGTLSIPAGATLVSLTGAGGTGGNNYWYDPGQPYIPDTRTYAWDPYNAYGTGGAAMSGAFTAPTPSGVPASNDFLSTPPTGAGQSVTSPLMYSDWGSPPESRYHMWYYTVLSAQTGGSAGQPYIAPSSGGGPYYGPDTTATLNGTTRTWTGGYDSGVVGTSSTQTITSSGAGQSLTYSVGSGGSLSYTYTY